MMKVMLIVGSVREGRSADKVVNWVLPQLQADTELQIDVADLKEIDLPFYNETAVPMMARGQYQNPKGTAWAKRVAEADAFIMVTSEYNFGPPAALKNAIDWVYDGWLNKPVGFISYGAIAAGTRAVEQLRQNLNNVKLHSTTASVHIPMIWQAFDEQGAPVQKENLNTALQGMVEELKMLQSQLKS